MNNNFLLHITYDKFIDMKTLVYCLDNVTKGINDLNRSEGVSNFAINKYPILINKVNEGSIIFDIVITFAAKIATNLIVEFIKKRFRDKHNNNDNNCYNIFIQNNTININIINGNKDDNK